MKFKYNDGGRSKYFKAKGVGDCAIRSIAIALEKDYKEVYNDLKKLNGGKSCRNGTPKSVDKKYLEQQGWIKLKGIMEIGSGIKYHLNEYDLRQFIRMYPRMIVQVSHHLTTIIDGVLNDTYDCTRDGERGVYSIWVKGTKIGL